MNLKQMSEYFKSLKFWVLVGLILAATAAGKFAFDNGDNQEQFWPSFFSNLATELTGAAITYVLFDLIISRRDKQIDDARAEQLRKEDMDRAERWRTADLERTKRLRRIDFKRQKRQREEDEARVAQLHKDDAARFQSWIIEDAERQHRLRQEDDARQDRLRQLDLQREENLRKEQDKIDWEIEQSKWLMKFRNAKSFDERRDILEHMNDHNILFEADLSGANLDNQDLSEYNMSGVSLFVASLKGANLSKTLLQGADLEGADLIGARIGFVHYNTIYHSAQFDDKTILPDGTNASEKTDLLMFTDPTHWNFFRSELLESPAGLSEEFELYPYGLEYEAEITKQPIERVSNREIEKRLDREYFFPKEIDEDEELPPKGYPRLREMAFRWKIVKVGDELSIRGFEEHIVKLKNRNEVIDDKRQVFRIKAWVRKVTGQQSVNIYDLIVVRRTNKTLAEMREDYLDSPS